MSYDHAVTTSAVVHTTAGDETSDATQVVQEFVYRYYMMLTDAPHDAWRSYTVAAQYMHVDGDVVTAVGANLKPAIGQHQIHSNIMYQQFFECEFRICSINVQATPSAHVVLVTGEMSRNQNEPVTFVQTFLIKCIHEINQYAICNSILKVFTEA